MIFEKPSEVPMYAMIGAPPVVENHASSIFDGRKTNHDRDRRTVALARQSFTVDPLQGKLRQMESSGTASLSSPSTEATPVKMSQEDRENAETRATCDVLCSLGSSTFTPTSAAMSKNALDSTSSLDSPCEQNFVEKRRKAKPCPKQHQLPMFLSKTYHMIDRCDPEIATWSAAGDNFVVKNVEKFASNVLPLYFKHSNFSSFARQLNFYGFRKLRSDPILTSDVDPRTSCYVRFYHEKFQKHRPELLHQIKRATKSDQQSKDEVESLKHEISKLKDCIGQVSSEMDRKLAEMSYEYNRRITTLSAEYEKLASLVTQILTRAPTGDGFQAPEGGVPRVPDLMHSLSQVAAMSLQTQLRPPTATPSTQPSSSTAIGSASSLSASISTLGAVAAAALGAGSKRAAPEEPTSSSSKARTN